MNHRVHIADGEEVDLRLHVQNLVHGGGPINAAARDIPVPQATPSAAQRRVDAVAHGEPAEFGHARAGGLPPPRGSEREHDDARTRQKQAAAQAVRAPVPERAAHRFVNGELPEWRVQIMHGGDHVRAVRQGQAHGAGVLREGRQRLRRSQAVDQLFADSGAVRQARHDASRRIGDEDVLLMIERAPRQVRRERDVLVRVVDVAGRRVDAGRDRRGDELEIRHGGRQHFIAHIHRLQHRDENDRGQQADDRQRRRETQPRSESQKAPGTRGRQ